MAESTIYPLHERDVPKLTQFWGDQRPGEFGGTDFLREGKVVACLHEETQPPTLWVRDEAAQRLLQPAFGDV